MNIEKIERLKSEIEKKQAQLDKLVAVTKEKERKQDMRRKILIGAYYLNKAKNEEGGFEKLAQEMNNYLKKKSDRELFGLEISDI